VVIRIQKSEVIPTFVNIDSCVVIAGLDPAIHLVEAKNVFAMDARVKPGHDELRVVKVGIRSQKSEVRKKVNYPIADF